MKYSPTTNNYYNPNSKRLNNLFKLYQTPRYQCATNWLNKPDFPFVVSLEFTNYCNLHCLFCARSVMTRPQGAMKSELFYKIIKELRENGTLVKVNGYGENLMHPYACKFIEEIKKENKLYFTSNFQYITETKMNCFIKNKVDVIQISFQGVDKKSYEEQRLGANYEHLIQNVKMLINKRGNAEYPFIHMSTTILDETHTQIEDFINFCFDLGVDSVGIGRTDYDRVIGSMIKSKHLRRMIKPFKDRQTLNKVPDHSYLYRYIDINWDGIVVSSFFDFNEFIPVGDLNKQSLHTVWNHSEVLNALRTLESNDLLHKMSVFGTFYHAWNMGKKSYNLANA